MENLSSCFVSVVVLGSDLCWRQTLQDGIGLRAAALVTSCPIVQFIAHCQRDSVTVYTVLFNLRHRSLQIDVSFCLGTLEGDVK